jgi:hypothetical protein
MKRKTIGENPLDALVPVKETAAARKTRRKKEPPRLTAQEERELKERLTVHLRRSVIDRAKDAVYWTPGLTLAGLAEDAFVKVLEELERKHGGRFDPRRGELKGGRPVK